MRKNILAIFEELEKISGMKEDAKADKERAEEKLYSIIDKSLTLKERIEARKAHAETIDYWNGEAQKANEKIKWLNMYSIALRAEAVRDARVVICQSFIENFDKIDGVPARYKKVQKFIDCLDCEHISAYYSEFYGTVKVFIRGNGDSEEHLYITKKENGEEVIDLERCKKHADHTARTPQDIAENLERFLQAQKELEKAEQEYNEKVNAIKEGCFCLGLDFNGRY